MLTSENNNFTPNKKISNYSNLLTHEDQFIKYFLIDDFVMGYSWSVKCPNCKTVGMTYRKTLTECKNCLTLFLINSYSSIHYSKPMFKILNFYFFKLYYYKSKRVNKEKFYQYKVYEILNQHD